MRKSEKTGEKESNYGMALLVERRRHKSVTNSTQLYKKADRNIAKMLNIRRLFTKDKKCGIKNESIASGLKSTDMMWKRNMGKLLEKLEGVE